MIMGDGAEMDAIAAVILGGTSLSGGVGFVLPCLIAVSYNRILAGIRLQHRVINHVFNSHFHSPFPFEAFTC